MNRPFGELTFRGQLGRLRPMAEEAVRRWPLAAPRVRRLHYGENSTYEVRDRDGGRRVLRIARPGYQSLAAIRSATTANSPPLTSTSGTKPREL